MSLPKLERFSIVRQLGDGGFGTVYEAFDKKTDRTVALKVLHRAQPAWIYRFKQEFRALAGIRHKNLVTLYELGSEGDRWLLSMELVDGVTFVRWVEGCDPPEHGAADRLRDALRQLVEGVSALHDAGKLHRDLKPSNVLVTRDGRVVILDFGLITELDESDQDSIGLVGTPAFMSPEQCRDGALSPAGDWYSVGVMLYRSLTGQLPFEGSPLLLIEEKLRYDAILPSNLEPKVPKDLEHICLGLLRRDPDERLGGADVLALLETPRGPEPSRPRSLPPGAGFVGRSRELERLRDAYDEARSGTATVATVHGRSGIGKTALVGRFVDQVRQRDPEAVVLRGRCYEHESVPFKALDNLMDELARFLRAEPARLVDAVKPRSVASLTRVFPVLRRVEAYADAPAAAPADDEHELRQRAARALRELLARLADRRPTVLVIDDLQWGDLDSAVLLGEVLWPPEAPPLMLVCGYRRDDVDTNEFLQGMVMLQQSNPELSMVDVPVDELPEAEATEMARGLIAGGGGADRAQRIAKEARGSPFFITELVSEAATTGEIDPASGDPDTGQQEESLERLIHRRVQRLSPGARALLERVAVAGRPLEATLVRQAPRGEAHEEMILELRAERLMRVVESGATVNLECYHDRIRESVVDSISQDERAAHHRWLADRVAELANPDPELLAVHLAEAGDPQRAAQRAEEAADRAAGLLAFEHAARWYGVAVQQREIAGLGDDETLRVKLGEAFAKAGRGADAAREWLEAAKRSERAAGDLRRRAAAQLLRSGHIKRGLRLARASLGDLGIHVPRARWRIVLRLLWLRLLISLRLMRGVEPRDDADRGEVDRLESVRRMAAVLILFDFFTGFLLACEFVVRALRLGDAYSLVTGLGTEAVTRSVRPRGERHGLALLEQARDIAERHQNPESDAQLPVLAGSIYFALARPRECIEACEQAESVAQAKRVLELSFDQASTRLFWGISSFYLGRFDELVDRYGRYREEYRRLGNLYGETALLTRLGWIVAALRDEPEATLDDIEELRRQWFGDFRGGHHPVLFAKAWLNVYAGRGREATDLTREFMAGITAARLERIPAMRLDASLLRANAALCAATEIQAVAPDARTRADEAALDGHLTEAESAAAELEQLDVGLPLALMARANVAAIHGNVAAAVRQLESAHGRARKVGLDAFAMAARWRAAGLDGGHQDAAITEARRWFRERCRQPAAFARLLVPGVPVEP